MIQIKAPDGSIVQFPDGTDDGTITGVMAKNYPAPAPDLAGVAAGATAELAQQPGGLDAKNAADLASLAPPAAPARSWMDTLKSAVAGAPAALASVGDQGAYLARGARRGVANLAGLPVDAMNAILGLDGSNVSQKPFLGSKSIDEILGGFGAIPEVRPPATTTERVLSRVGEEIGAAAPVVGGAVRAGRMGVEAARGLPTLARMFVEPAAINPAAFASKEMATAAAAGSGAAAAGEISHAAGVKEHSGAHNTIDILGALAGAGMLGAGRIVGKPISDVGQAIFARDKFSNDAVKNNVVDRIANNADTVPKVAGQPVDTAPLVEAINRDPRAALEDKLAALRRFNDRAESLRQSRKYGGYDDPEFIKARNERAADLAEESSLAEKINVSGGRVDATIPGFKDSLADRTGDSGLAALEYGRQSGPNAGQFVQRRSDNTAAVDTAMNKNAPDGNPANLRSELDLERGRRLTDAGVQTQNATDAFERATQALQPAMTGEGRGANIRSALEGASGEARAILQQAWEPINNSGAHVDMAPLAQDFAGVRRGLSTAEAERFQPPEANIPGRLSGDREVTPAIPPSGDDATFAGIAKEIQGVDRTNKMQFQVNLVPSERETLQRAGIEVRSDGWLSNIDAERIMNEAERRRKFPDTGTPAVTEAITQPINEVTGLRSALTDASREAMTAGRTNEARIINEHVDALDRYLDRAVPADLRADYDRARAATVDFHDRFTRPQTAVAQTLDRQQGLYRQPDSAVASKFVQADEGKISDFQALMRETGHDDRTVSAVRDQILADVRDRGLLNRPDQLREYLGRYSTVLSDPRFDATRGQLDNAAGLRRSLDEATTAETNLTRDLGTPDKAGTGTVGKYLAYGDERSQEALKGVIASKNPGAAMDEMLTFVNNAPEAVAGAKKSFWDLMQSKARSNGETTKTMDGAQPWMPNKLKNFLDDPAHQAVAERLYRDDPEQLANVRKIAEELQGVDLRARGKAPNTSGTTQGISNVLTPETLQSRFYAYKRGQTSLGFMLTALGSVAARRLVRGAQGEAMEKLLDRALLDPELAAQLLKEHNPANRAALARTAKAYLGNEASTITDLLTEPADPVKSAIMKKDDSH